MDVLFIHVGQCGISLGDAIWSVPSFRSLVNKRKEFPCIHIDAEQKVIRQVTKKAGCPYKPANCVTAKRGRGSNWAMGYHGNSEGSEDTLLANAMASIHSELQCLPLVTGFVLTHSLSGGTGSGFGSRLLQELHDCYEKMFKISICVMPCASGESPMECYNSVLCLESLQLYADMILVFRNDQLLDFCQAKGSKKAVKMEDLNRAAAATVCNFLRPVQTERAAKRSCPLLQLWDACTTLTPCPSWKFCTGVSQSALKANGQPGRGVKDLVKLAVSQISSPGKGTLTLASQLTCRGLGYVEIDTVSPSVAKGLNFVDWNPFPLDLRTDLTPKSPPSVTVVANSSNIALHLQRIVERAEVMHEAGAYLHWFSRYNVQQTDIAASCETVKSVVHDYRSSL